MAVQIKYPNGEVQWLSGALYPAHDGFTVHQTDGSHRDFASDHRVVSTAPDGQIVNWNSRPAPFSDPKWWA